MSCRRLESENLLSELGDALDPHVEQCDDCRERLQGYQGTTTHRLPPDWKQRTLARIAALRNADRDSVLPSVDPTGRAPPGRQTRSPPPARDRPQSRWRSCTSSVLTISAAALLLLFLAPGGTAWQSVPDPHVTEIRTSSDVVAARSAGVFPAEQGPRWAGAGSIVTMPRLDVQVVNDTSGSAHPQRAAATMGQQSDAHPGQILLARPIPTGVPYFEIRVYRGDRLLVRCPVDHPPACVPASSSLWAAYAADTGNALPDRDTTAEVPSGLIWKIPSIGTYWVVLFASQQPIAPPRGSVNDDVTAARAAGADASETRTIHVH
ncbi:MAG: hypothetical protein E6J91_40525 [Deltaproteobacteria bacterium]|nr:MAG: hypothetical protein E6J91_40525 [Deltaproteobacteria bacterium]